MDYKKMGLTKEQITKCNHYRKLAGKYFESIYPWYKNRKPYQYAIHHKDETLRHTDIERYIEWRIEDLVIIENSKHIANHNQGNNNAAGKRSAESRQRMSEAQMGNKHACGKRSPEVGMKISKALKGHTPWNKGIKTGPPTDEYKQNMSVRMKQWWAERKQTNTI